MVNRPGGLRFQQPPLWAVGHLLVGITLVMFGFSMAREESRMARELPVSPGWPHAEGVVVKNGGIKSARRGPPGLRIRYAYTVEGERFTGRRLWVHGSTGASRELRELRHRLGVGTEVRVYFDPQRPERSVLFPGVPGRRPLWDPAGLLMIAAAIAGGGWIAVRAIERSATIYRYRR